MIRMEPRIAVIVSLGLLVGVLVSFSGASAVEAQGPQAVLRVSDVVVTEVAEMTTTVQYLALVTVENASDGDFEGAQRIDYQIDDGERTLVYVVTKLAAGGDLGFTFRFELPPGDRTLEMLLGEAAHETGIHVAAADLSLTVDDQRVMTGGFVEFDVNATNEGDRLAREVELIGRWERVDDGEVWEVDFGQVVETLEVGGSVAASPRFKLSPGVYQFQLTASTVSVEDALQNNVAEVAYDVEFVELEVSVNSIEVVKWHTEGRGLVSMSLEVSNVGVDDSGRLVVGVECVDGLCSGLTTSSSIDAGTKAMVTLEAWVNVGSVAATVYAGANDDGFRWGEENVIETVIEVPEGPPLEWSLSAVSDADEFRYWSDGSANAVFETTMVNVGSDLVAGELQILVSCLQTDEIVEGCGGEITVAIDPEMEPDVTEHVVRVPKGQTALHFSYGEDTVLIAEAVVPERILGVDREIWDCFSDRSNVRRGSPSDSGVGCGGSRNEYVTKWEIGKPILVWTEGDEEYVAIFDEVLEYLAPLLNVEFERVAAKSQAQLRAYLGVSRSDRISGLRCNFAAGCASSDVDPGGTILSGDLVVWPPASTYTESGRNHMIYSIALHELIHVLTGMQHRHADRTSVMGYDSLDYTTLGETDEALLRIASHSLVKPGMRFSKVGELIVFEDEMSDRTEEAEITTAEVLRRAHAKMMDAGSASYKLSGGWPGCDFVFDDADYSIAGLRPRSSRWVHFNDETIDLYLVRSQARLQLIEYWVFVGAQWRPIPSQLSQRLFSFRDSFSSPLKMLSSIVIYGDDAEFTVISEKDGILFIEVALEGADVHTEWSNNTRLDVQLQVDTADYTIPNYQMEWSFEPEETNVCDSYRVEASEGEYGLGFEFPDAIRNGSRVLRLTGGR